MNNLLFGITNNSIMAVSKHLVRLKIRHNLVTKNSTLLKYDYKLQRFLFKNTPVILFNNTSVFKLWLAIPRVRKIPVICVIVDSPIYLMDISGIKLLDIPDCVSGINSVAASDKKVSTIWQPIKNAQDIDWKPLQEAVVSISSQKDNPAFFNNIQIQKTKSIITNLIAEQGEQFLDRYNTFVMQGLRYKKEVDKQDVIIIILDYLFGKTGREYFEENIKVHLPSRGKGPQIYKDFLGYIDSPKGDKMLHTLKYIATLIRSGSSEKDINFDQIAKDNEVKDYDIRYLSIVYSRLLANKSTDRSKIKNKGV